MQFGALALLLSSASAGSWACGFHTDQTIAQAMLNLHYPDALHVNGAVWSAQQKGLLPLDRERLQATGSRRKLLDTRAYHEVLKALYALGESFEQTSPRAEGSGMAVVLTETMLWTRYPAGGEIKSHVNGPEPDDLVIVTDEPVVLTIEEGKMTVDEAMEKGLIRLYGEPEQERSFVANYGKIGDEPLAAADQKKLLRAILWTKQPAANLD